MKRFEVQVAAGLVLLVLLMLGVSAHNNSPTPLHEQAAQAETIFDPYPFAPPVYLPLIRQYAPTATATAPPAPTATPPPTATAVPQPDTPGYFGMNTYLTGLERVPPTDNDGEDGISRLITRAQEANIGWIREEISWGNIERNGKERYDWYIFDDRLVQLDRAGFGIVGMIATTPDWARVPDCAERVLRYQGISPTLPETYWCPPANPQDYADVVAATVERYDGDGIADAPGSPRVAVWQLWNEPNAWETFPGTPREFGELLLAGYRAAKTADPSATVVVAGVYVFDAAWNDGAGHRDGLSFLGDVLAAYPQAWEAFDVLAIHPYMPDVAPDQPGLFPLVTYWGRLDTTNRWLTDKTNQYGGERPTLWVTETGWPTCDAGLASTSADRWARYAPSLPGGGSLANSFPCHSERDQATYMLRSHILATIHGVQHLSYLQLEDKFDGLYYPQWGATSILGGKASDYRPKEAYTAYQVMTGLLGNATFDGLGSLHTYEYRREQSITPASRYHFRFRVPLGTVNVLWDTSGNVYEVTMPITEGQQIEYLLSNGSSSSFNQDGSNVRFTIGPEPVYLVQVDTP